MGHPQPYPGEIKPGYYSQAKVKDLFQKYKTKNWQYPLKIGKPKFSSWDGLEPRNYMGAKLKPLIYLKGY